MSVSSNLRKKKYILFCVLNLVNINITIMSSNICKQMINQALLCNDIIDNQISYYIKLFDPGVEVGDIKRFVNDRVYSHSCKCAKKIKTQENGSTFEDIERLHLHFSNIVVAAIKEIYEMARVNSKWKCGYCFKALSSEKNLLRHEEKHDNKNKFLCLVSTCRPKKFLTLEERDAHLKQCHPDYSVTTSTTIENENVKSGRRKRKIPMPQALQLQPNSQNIFDERDEDEVHFLPKVPLSEVLAPKLKLKFFPKVKTTSTFVPAEVKNVLVPTHAVPIPDPLPPATIEEIRTPNPPPSSSNADPKPKTTYKQNFSLNASKSSVPVPFRYGIHHRGLPFIGSNDPAIIKALSYISPPRTQPSNPTDVKVCTSKVEELHIECKCDENQILEKLNYLFLPCPNRMK